MSANEPRRLKWDWFTTIGAAIALVVALVAGYAGVTNFISGDESPSYTYSYSPPTTQATVVAAFLGDSYTSGSGASPQQGYAPITSVKMCWSYAGFGQGGTGYTNPGQSEQNESIYQDRVHAVAAVKPDIVIVQGTSSDTDPTATFEGAATTFARLTEELPGTTVVVVGPASPPSKDASEVATISDAIRKAADQAGFAFLDPAGDNWIPTSAAFFISDGIHPNDEGYALYSDALYSRLKQLNVPQRENCNP